MMAEAMVYAGYLRKSPPEKKLTMATWHKRYFVLRENKNLDYFKNEKEKKPIKVINLRLCKSVEAGLYHKSFKHVFSITTTERVYYLVADSSDEMEMWVEQLCKACGFIKLEQRNSPVFFKRKSPVPNTYARSPPLSATCPAGMLSSSLQSSRMSNLSSMSPTSLCPVKQLSLERKARSSSDPPEPNDERGIRVPSRRNMSLVPDLAKAQLSQFNGSYNTVHAPRPSSQDVYDIVPPPREDPTTRNSGQDYDIVPPPRPDSGSSFGASGFSTNSVYDVVPRRQSSADENYDVPPPRPTHLDVTSSYLPPNQGSSAISPVSNHLRLEEKEDTYDTLPPQRETTPGEETYDTVPPPRASACFPDQDTYDVLPSPRRISEEQGNYDMVPPLRSSASIPDQDTYDVLPSPRRISEEQGNYDMVPPPRLSASIPDQDTYDVPPSPRRISEEQGNYDTVPLPRKHDPNSSSVSPHRVTSGHENYDVVPMPREATSQEMYDVLPSRTQRLSVGQETYDVVPPPRGVSPGHENYDVLPSPRSVTPEQETYDVLPPRRPPSQDVYDVVPTPRRTSQASDTYDVLPRPISASEQNNRTPSAVLKDSPQEIYDVVPPPKPSPYRGNVYDVVPSPIRCVDPSQEHGLSSPAKQCPLDSGGGYNQPLPAVPPEEESRDSGVYGSGDIYNYPTATNGPSEGQEKQQNFVGHQGMSGSPVVNRSTKPPPEVDRNSKPGPPKDHSYCNMPPPVNRGTKPRQPPPGMNSYENYPSKNRTLERVRSLSINAPHQNSHTASPSPDDDSYCQMEPVRSESTRCYSFSKKPVDVGYEEMAPMPVNRNSTSSSSSCCEEDEETYTSMFPPDPRLSSHMAKPKHKKDLQYAEVQLVSRSPRSRRMQPERPSTHYTLINEDATQALRQTCHARKEHLSN